MLSFDLIKIDILSLQSNEFKPTKKESELEIKQYSIFDRIVTFQNFTKFVRYRFDMLIFTIRLSQILWDFYFIF